MKKFYLSSIVLVSFGWLFGNYPSRYEAAAAMRQWIKEGGTEEYFIEKKERKIEIVKVALTKKEISELSRQEFETRKLRALFRWCDIHNVSWASTKSCRAESAKGHLRKGGISFEDDWKDFIREQVIQDFQGFEVPTTKSKSVVKYYPFKERHTRSRRNCRLEEESNQYLCFQGTNNQVVKRFRW